MRQAAVRESSTGSTGPGLVSFLGPRYWSTWLLLAWMRVVALLPLRLALAIHRVPGRAAYRLAGRKRERIEACIAACFPDLSSMQVRSHVKAHFEALSMSLAEIAIAWFGRPERLSDAFEVSGIEHLEAALAKGKGVILYSGHFTPLEICVPRIKALVPRFAFMYARRGNALLNEIQHRCRERAAHESFPCDDVRTMLRALSLNFVVWYAPDRTRAGGCDDVELLGQPYRLSNALSRIAQSTGALVVPLSFHRRADRPGYVLRFEPALSGFPSGDRSDDTRRLASVLGRFIGEAPSQYLWNYREFERSRRALSRAPEAPKNREPGQMAGRGWHARWGAELLCLAVAVFIVTFDNGEFWRRSAELTLPDDHKLGILLSLGAIQLLSLVAILALVPTRWLLKGAALVLLLVAAVCSYFSVAYGVVIDQAMIRNVMETNWQESAPFFSGSLVVHLLVYFVVPAGLVIAMPTARQSLLRSLARRSLVIGASLGLLAGIVLWNYQPVSFFAQEHRAVRLHINPGYPLLALGQFLAPTFTEPPQPPELLEASAPAPGPSHARPSLVVLVLGETARADRFQYNGYGRPTNRFTAAYDLVNYPDVSACGTSTADSLPCIFSKLGRDRFSHKAAARFEDLFHLFQRLGVDVHWRDNSTGCKDICTPESFEELANMHDERLCDETGCFDEILLRDVDELIADTSRDHLLILHQRGSHGPAYHTNVPDDLKRFFPECTEANLRNCPQQKINNAYDNTILYTDYFLSRVIELLLDRADDFDVAMLYVSDHGESLGESGLFLHGFPYAIAPEEQTHVPMLFWASTSFMRDNGLDPGCLHRTSGKHREHDALFHTLLPIFGVQTPEYAAVKDLFAGCRIS